MLKTLIFFSILGAISAQSVLSGSTPDLDTFYNFYDGLNGKTNVTITIFRSDNKYECCAYLNKTYCSSYNLKLTACCKNMETIDIKCTDIIRIEYVIYYTDIPKTETPPILSIGIIVGIVIAGAFFLLLLALLIYLFITKSKVEPKSEEK